jgi:hypothetical protein
VVLHQNTLGPLGVKMASSQINPNVEFCINWNEGVWSIQNNTNLEDLTSSSTGFCTSEM